MADNSNKPTRWAIVGCGVISNDFCLALRTLSHHEHKIVAVAARSLESAQQFAEKHGAEKAYGSYESLAADPEVDVVYIGTINPNHVSLSLMMLEAGKNVLCEKPMALSANGVHKVVELAQQKNLLFLEGIWSRFFPSYRQLKTEVDAGTIGSVKGLTAYFGLDFNWEKKERISKKEQGGGVMVDIGIYLVQLACFVFDNEKPEHIYACGALHHTGVDKSVSVLLSYKGGRTAQLVARGDCLLPNSAVVYGTKGTLEFPANFWCPLQLKTPTKSFEFTLPTTSEPTHCLNSAGFVYEIEAVRKALLDGKGQTVEVTHADSLLISEIQDEILRQVGVSYDTS